MAERIPGQRNSQRRMPPVVWPAILIGLGVVFLGANLGWFAPDWQTIWRFWPVVLILLGVEVLLTRSGVWRTGSSVSGFVIAGIAILLIWAVGSAASSGVVWSEPWSSSALAGSGNVITETRDFQDFDQIEISSAFKVEIVQSDAFNTQITADDNVMERIVTSQVGNTLRISLDNVGFWNRPTLEARIALPDLSAVRLSGATKGTIVGFKSTDDLTLELSGASTLNGEIESGDTRIRTSGASKLSLVGAGDSADLAASGASTMAMEGFQIRDAKVKASGASNTTVNVTGRLDAEASGASRISYVGNPVIGSLNSDRASTIGRR